MIAAAATAAEWGPADLCLKFFLKQQFLQRGKTESRFVNFESLSI